MTMQALRENRLALVSAALGAALLTSTVLAAAQETRPVGGGATGTISVAANLVVVPAVVFDKRGAPVAGLTKDDFALAVDDKPQTVRYFDREADVPLTVGLLVDTSRSQTGVLDDEEKASGRFLESMLAPATAARPADKAFVMQFGRTAELLQDVTDSRPLLAAGLKEIGTEAPGSTDDETSQPSDAGNNGSGSTNGNNNGGGYGRGGRGGNGNGSNGSGNSGHDRGGRGGGTVLYDTLFLSSNDVLAKQTGRRAVILLTDGVDRHSKESLTEGIEAAQRANVVVYAIYYKGEDRRDFNRSGFPGGRGGYGGYGGYGGRGGYPGGGGNPGSDGTYPDPDGKKILQRICGETGGHMFEVKGKEGVDGIYKQIGDELRTQYRLGFTPSTDAATTGYHTLKVTLTNPGNKKLEVQTREGYYSGVAKSR